MSAVSGLKKAAKSAKAGALEEFFKSVSKGVANPEAKSAAKELLRNESLDVAAETAKFLKQSGKSRDQISSRVGEVLNDLYGRHQDKSMSVVPDSLSSRETNLMRSELMAPARKARNEAEELTRDFLNKKFGAYQETPINLSVFNGPRRVDEAIDDIGDVKVRLNRDIKPIKVADEDIVIRHRDEIGEEEFNEIKKQIKSHPEGLQYPESVFGENAYVATDKSGNLIGGVHVGGNLDSQVNYASILPEYQGQGIGKKIYKAAAESEGGVLRSDTTRSGKAKGAWGSMIKEGIGVPARDIKTGEHLGYDLIQPGRNKTLSKKEQALLDKLEDIPEKMPDESPKKLEEILTENQFHNVRKKYNPDELKVWSNDHQELVDRYNLVRDVDKQKSEMKIFSEEFRKNSDKNREWFADQKKSLGIVKKEGPEYEKLWDEFQRRSQEITDAYMAKAKPIENQYRSNLDLLDKLTEIRKAKELEIAKSLYPNKFKSAKDPNIERNKIIAELEKINKKSGNALFGAAGLAALGLGSGEAQAGENMEKKKKPSWDAAPPSDEELNESLGSKALGAVAKAAEWFDARTGAPTRKAVSVLQDDPSDISGAWDAAKAQYAAPTELAPTGKQLALRSGLVGTTALSEAIPGLFNESGEGWQFQKGGWADPTAAGAAGLGLDIALDPTNLIPVGAVAKGVAGGAKAGIGATKAVAKGAVKGTGELVSFIKSMKKVAPEVAEKTVKLKSADGGFTKAAFNSVADTVKEVKKLVTPGVSPKWEATRQIAIKNGIDPNLIAGGALEFGPGSLISRSRQKLAQGIGGETYRAKHLAGLGKIYEATNNVVKKIGDGVEPLAKIDAGEVIATEYKLATKDFFDKMDITYNTVLSQLPPNAPIPQNALKGYRSSFTPVIDTLTQRSKNKFLNPQVRQQAAALANDLKKASKANGTMQELREGMVQLKDAFENSGLSKDMPLETKVLRDLYGKTSKAYIEGTREFLGDEVADALLDNNKAMTEWFKTTERIDDLVSKGLSGEEIYRKAIENADSNMLKDLKLVFSDKPGVIKRAKAAFIDSLMRPDEDGIFSFARFNNKVRDPKTAMVLSQLFEPKELQELLELTKMGEDMGPQILNPSRTAEFLGLELSPKNIAGEAAQRGIVDVLEQQARGRGVIPPVAPTPAPKETLSKAFVENLGYGAAFNTAAEGLGSALQDPKSIAAKEVMRQSGRMIEPEEDIDVPPDYVPQLEKDLGRNGKMSNTEKAKLLYRIKKEGKISSSVLKQLHGEF